MSQHSRSFVPTNRCCGVGTSTGSTILPELGTYSGQGLRGAEVHLWALGAVLVWGVLVAAREPLGGGHVHISHGVGAVPESAS